MVRRRRTLGLPNSGIAWYPALGRGLLCPLGLNKILKHRYDNRVRANYFQRLLYKYDVSMNPEPNHIYQKAFSNCWNGPSVLWKSRPQAQPNAWGYESWFSERALGIVERPHGNCKNTKLAAMSRIHLKGS